MQKVQFMKRSFLILVLTFFITLNLTPASFVSLEDFLSSVIPGEKAVFTGSHPDNNTKITITFVKPFQLMEQWNRGRYIVFTGGSSLKMVSNLTIRQFTGQIAVFQNGKIAAGAGYNREITHSGRILTSERNSSIMDIATIVYFDSSKIVVNWNDRQTEEISLMRIN